jgi:hypothetical protein
MAAGRTADPRSFAGRWGGWLFAVAADWLVASVNALYKVDSLKLRLTLVREQLRIYRSEMAYLATRDASTVQPEVRWWRRPPLLADANMQGFVCAVYVKQPRSQPVKRRAPKKGDKGAQKNSNKTKAQFEYRVRVLTGAVVKFTPLPDALQSSLVLVSAGFEQKDGLDVDRVMQVEDNRAKLLRGSAVGLTLLSPVWSEGNSLLSFAAIFSDGTQVEVYGARLLSPHMLAKRLCLPS